MSKPIERGKYKSLYNSGEGSNKYKKWLKRTMNKLRRIDEKNSIKNEVENIEELDSEEHDVSIDN